MNTYPQTEETTILIFFYFDWLVSGFFCKLGLANVKTAIITMLQLHRKHNLGNNSDYICLRPILICSSCLTLISGAAGASPGQWSKGSGMLSPTSGREWAHLSHQEPSQMQATTGHLIPGSDQLPARDMSPGKGTQKGLQEREGMMLHVKQFFKVCE